MNKNNLQKLAGVLAAAAVIAAVYGYMSRQKPLGSRPYAGIPKDAYVRIELSKNETLIRLEKSGEGWNVTSPVNAPADKESVESLLNSVSALEVGELTTSRKEKQDEYEVGETTKSVRVKLYREADTPVVDFLLGRNAYDFLHYYIRFPGSDEIRVEKGMFRQAADRPLDQWLKKPDPPAASSGTITGTPGVR